MITNTARITAWLLAFAAAVVTLGPQAVRPHTGISHDLEHAVAFALVGLVFGLGYPNSHLLLALSAIAAVALMEIVQQWVPGRHVSLSDFIFNGLGACAGIAAAAVLGLFMRRWSERRTR